uniref:Uncharacterized protein n=1 Tax=Oryza sativa subsp. indica TaxID=39946 RepID=A0A8F3AF64_ORYSI|nr:hypothetical protein Xa7_IRBB7.39 [Oryza sativa Indica Group]
MENPALAGGIHGYVRPDEEEEEEAIDGARRVRRLLASSAVLFTSAAASVIIYAVAIDPSAAQAFIGFALFLLGVSLALLAPVADQFPAVARIGVAVAVALRGYLFGAN